LLKGKVYGLPQLQLATPSSKPLPLRLLGLALLVLQRLSIWLLRVVARVGQILLQLLALVLGVVERVVLELALDYLSLLEPITQLLLVVVAQLHQAQTAAMVKTLI
jgi:hypothetical protein